MSTPSSRSTPAVALTDPERPDLVVMGIRMPKFDGITAAERIAPVVILTAFSQRARRARLTHTAIVENT